jgi:hypothetical protein
VCQDGCDPGRNQCNECSAGERRCAPGQNASQICDDGIFAAPEPCATGLSCTAGECRCDPFASPVCLGDELLTCNEDETGFDPAPACVGSVLRICDGDASPSQTDCGTAGACQTAADGPGSCD